MRRAIVTGASSGIGKGIYEHLKAIPDFEAGLSRALPDFEVEGLSRRGPDKFIDFTTEEAGYFARCAPVDVLILNHGIMPFAELPNVDPLVSTNLTSYYFALFLQATEAKPVKRGGSIILVSSVAGVTGDIEVPLYAALKAGVSNLARSFAKRLGAQQGIRVNAIAPGFFKSNLAGGSPAPEALLKDIVLGQREADVSELLPVVEMLIQCPYITGQTIVVDGGLSL